MAGPSSNVAVAPATQTPGKFQLLAATFAGAMPEIAVHLLLFWLQTPPTPPILRQATMAE